MKTAELTGVALDWAVAKCEKSFFDFQLVESFIAYHNEGEENYSTDWAQGGPIIERELMEVNFLRGEGEWYASVRGGFYEQYGTTPLIAAMRCYVASKLGDDVEISQGLTYEMS